MRFTDFIWDFDGTLCDTYPHICTLFSKVLDEMGIQYDSADLRQRLSTTFSSTLLYYSDSQATRDEIYRRYFWYENRELGSDDVRPYEGIIETLEYIKAHGGHNHINTHRGETLYKYLFKLKMRNYFEIIVNWADGYELKPSPQSVNSILSRRGVDCSQAVMIGDRELDMGAGKAAACSTILFNTNPIIRRETADWEVFHGLNIINIIEK